MRSDHRLVIGVLLLACAACSGPPAMRPPTGSPAELAGAACVRVRLARQGILADSPAADVRSELAQARVLAAAAARADPTYVALSGGIAALDDAVTRDDGPAAVLGLRVTTANCGQAAVTQPWPAPTSDSPARSPAP